jgi:hypothetical protein
LQWQNTCYFGEGCGEGNHCHIIPLWVCQDRILAKVVQG